LIRINGNPTTRTQTEHRLKPLDPKIDKIIIVYKRIQIESKIIDDERFEEEKSLLLEENR
jgi:hypothetical protein